MRKQHPRRAEAIGYMQKSPQTAVREVARRFGVDHKTVARWRIKNQIVAPFDFRIGKNNVRKRMPFASAPLAADVHAKAGQLLKTVQKLISSPRADRHIKPDELHELRSCATKIQKLSRKIKL